MSYIPNPADATQPADTVFAGTAAAELRALKAYVAGLAFGTPGLPMVVGSMRNLNARVGSAGSSSCNFSADQVVVAVGLSGAAWCLNNVNETINIATTGVNGMDTGAAPSSGYVAIYLIYNPVSHATDLLAVDVTSTLAFETYVGANMPSGYTASALISVWPTTAAGLLKYCTQSDRTILYQVPINLVSTVTPNVLAGGAPIAFSASPAAPRNARMISGLVEMSATSATDVPYASLFVGGGKSGTGLEESAILQGISCFIKGTSGKAWATFYDVKLLYQTMAYMADNQLNSAAVLNYAVVATDYTF